MFVVNDARALDFTSFTAAHRREAAAGFANFVAELPGYVLGEAYISSSAVARGLLTAVRWMEPVPWPTQVFSSSESAMQWAYARVVATTATRIQTITR